MVLRHADLDVLLYVINGEMVYNVHILVGANSL